MKIIIAFLYINSLALAATAQQTKTSTIIKWETYTDIENKFSFTYPNNWAIRVADTCAKVKVFIRSPKEGDNDIFIENLNVSVRKTGVEKMEAKELKRVLFGAFQTKLKDFELLKDTFTTSNKVEAYQIDYKHSQVINEENTTIKMLQVIFVKNFYCS